MDVRVDGEGRMPEGLRHHDAGGLVSDAGQGLERLDGVVEVLPEELRAPQLDLISLCVIFDEELLLAEPDEEIVIGAERLLEADQLSDDLPITLVEGEELLVESGVLVNPSITLQPGKPVYGEVKPVNKKKETQFVYLLLVLVQQNVQL